MSRARHILLGIVLATLLFGGRQLAHAAQKPLAYPNIDKIIAQIKARVAASNTRAKKSVPASKQPPQKVPLLPALPAVAATTSLFIVPPQKPLIPGPELNEKTRAALVNIICITRAGGYLRPISGSGVIIDPRGIILTNAHVAEYLLLKNYLVHDFVQCVARTGSPADLAYRVELMYLPQSWITRNKANIVSPNPTGTGEDDYALLAITGSIAGKEFPPTFPFLAPNTAFENPPLAYPVLLAGYPAELVGSIVTQRNLYAVSSETKINRGYYFPSDTDKHLDLLSFGGNILAQAGSSGGAIVDHYSGTLLGLLVTTTLGTTTAEKDLNGITVGHIDRSLTRETGKTLAQFTAEDPPALATQFAAGIGQSETRALVDEINK